MQNPKPYHRWTLILILSLTALRLTALAISPLGLHGDEAQYWAWSKNLDWGYFTKPPMIAWVIAATTSVFGDAEWAVRLSSPIIHPITTYIIFRTAQFAYDARTGFWAALIFFLSPAMWLSSGIVSTDVPLLLCWAIALNAWLHLRDRATWPRAVQLGIAVGLGMLGKYAMLFFLPALGLAFIFDPASRKALNSLKGYGAAAITFLIVAPNILWNANNDFATVSHTAANANLGSDIPFHPLELLTFWIDQLGVFGPVTLVLLCMALYSALRSGLSHKSFWLALFIASPLLIISIEALLSRANANWAITAYVAAPILLAHFALERGPRTLAWLRGGIIFNASVGLILSLSVLSPSFTNAIGMANSVKRLRAWPATVKVLEGRLAAGHEGIGFTMAATDKRILYYSLNYYGLQKTTPLKMWMLGVTPQNQAEFTAALPAQEGPVLIINYHADKVDEMQADFERLVPLEPLDIDLGGGKRRTLKLWAGYGYVPTAVDR